VTNGSQIVCTIDDSQIIHTTILVTNYGDPGVGTISFGLFDNSSPEQVVFPAVDLSNGQSHTFGDITPGAYNLVDTQSGTNLAETASCAIGDSAVDPRQGPITVPLGANIQCVYNYGNFAAVSGSVDNGNLPLSGWTVNLFETDVTPAVQISQTTDGAGNFAFGNLGPGQYELCEVLQSGWTESQPASGADCNGSNGYQFTLNFGDIQNFQFNNSTTGSASGEVWNDVSGNGNQDAGDSGLAGVTVGLYDASGANQLQTTTTDASGDYTFGNLTVGDYVIKEVLPAGDTETFPTSGSYAVTVNSDADSSGNDFGNFHDTTPPTTVFTSPDPDSTFDQSGIPISGVTTDQSDVASTTLAYSVYIPGEGDVAGSCDTNYTEIVSLINPAQTTTFNWSYNWVPDFEGSFCIKAHGQDIFGNLEASPFVMNITFKKTVAPTPPNPPAPNPTDSSGNGNSGGNGPIAGSLGVSSGAASGSANSGAVSVSVPVSNGDSVTNGTNGATETGGSAGVTNGGNQIAVNIGNGTTGQSGKVVAENASSKGNVGNETPGIGTPNQTASVIAGSSWLSWKFGLWLLIILIFIWLIIFFFKRRKKPTGKNKK
jgi:hypothetical protein